MIMMPLGNHLMPFFQLTPQQFSLLVAAYTITAGLSSFISAFFVDRFDRKKVLLFAFSGFIFGTLFCGFAPSYIFLLIGRIGAGAFGGLIASQILSIVSDVFPYQKRGMAMGIIMSSVSVASIAGVPFGLWIANRFSWNAPFIFIGLLGIVLIPLVTRYIPSMCEHLTLQSGKKSFAETVRNVVYSPSQRAALSLTATLMMGHFLIIPFVMPYMEFNVGFSRDQTPLIYLVGGILTMIGAPIIGRIADQFGKVKVYIIFVIISLLPVFLITNMGPMNYFLVLTVTGTWFLLSSGRTIPAQAMISKIPEPQQRGSFMSFNTAVQNLFIGLATLVAGSLITQDSTGKILHYNEVGYLSIGIIAASILLARKLSRTGGLT
jgi:predicted MFS family arabinose efflux permease